MWPFKKKTPLKEEKQTSYETVICIPGKWVNWEEFIVELVAATEGEYIAAGNILMNARKNIHYHIDFCEADDKMAAAFTYAGRGTNISPACIDAIKNHNSVIYLRGITGSPETAANIAFAAVAILKAGGIGIKVESAGKAFDRDQWLNLGEPFNLASLYNMFVIDAIVQQDGTVFSCGMQNLGLRDTIVPGEEFQEAVRLISIFSFYQLVDKPTIRHWETFSPDVASSRYRITVEQNQPYKEDKIFGNPFGMWRLARM